MKEFIFSLLSLLLYLSLTTAAPTQDVQERAVPLSPLADPFYTPPAGYESTAPGAILRHRLSPAPIAALTLLPKPLVAAHQILYRTTDTFGNATATVSTVLVPAGADYSKLLTYPLAEDASFLECSPSYVLQFASDILAQGTSAIEYFLITAALNRGWVVSVPDHLGPKSTFLANTQSGQATLDSIRAALSSTLFTGVSSSATLTMWGYSGGAIASGWASELASTYAPELKITGAVLGGTVPDINSTLYTVNAKPLAGLIPPGVLGLSHEYPLLASSLPALLQQNASADFYAADKKCFLRDILHYANDNFLYDYVTTRTVFTTVNPINPILVGNNMGHRAPTTVPILIYKGAKDKVSPLADTDALYASYCAGGADVQYNVDASASHLGLLVSGAGFALSWLQDRFDGVAVKSGCSTATGAGSLGPLNTQATVTVPADIEAALQSSLAQLESAIGDEGDEI